VCWACVGLALTYRNWMYGEIESSLNSTGTCYHSVRNLSCSHLLAKHKWTEICRSLVVPVVCISYWCLMLNTNVALSKRQTSVWDDAISAETCSRVFIHILCMCIVLVYEKYNYCTKNTRNEHFKTIGWVCSRKGWFLQCSVR